MYNQYQGKIIFMIFINWKPAALPKTYFSDAVVNEICYVQVTKMEKKIFTGTKLETCRLINAPFFYRAIISFPSGDSLVCFFHFSND